MEIFMVERLGTFQKFISMIEIKHAHYGGIFQRCVQNNDL